MTKRKLEKILSDPGIRRSVEWAVRHAPRQFRDDARQECWLAIFEAAPRYNARMAATLRTFLEHRARGAVLDYLRRQDPLTRDHRKAIKEGRADAPTINDIAQVAPGKLAEPASQHRAAEFAEMRDWVKQLPPRESAVVTDILTGRTLREAGAALSVNESRASQLHWNGIRRIRRTLELPAAA